jgi:cytochrome c556
MKGWIACAFLVATATLAAQAGQMAKVAITSAADYSTTMKDVNAQNGALRKAITSASEADVTAATAKLETDFKNVQAYWEDKKVDDATTAAKAAVTAVQTISKAAAAHDMAAATAALPTLTAQCGTCHMAHRNRLPDGTFEMK